MVNNNNTTQRRILHPVTVTVCGLALQGDIYPCYILLVQWHNPTKHSEKSLQYSALLVSTSKARPTKHNFASMFFSFKIKQKGLIAQESKKVKGDLVQFIAVSLRISDAVDSFLKTGKINYWILMMMTEVLRLQIFIFCIFRCNVCSVWQIPPNFYS